MKMFRKDEGFTLVELMVVVLIIGILVAIAVPVFLNASANAQAKSCQANQRTVVGAISTFNATYPVAALNIGTGTGAATAEVLGGTVTAKLFTAGASTQPVIKSIPTCPVANGEYVVGNSATGNNSVVSDIAKLTATGVDADFVDALHRLK